MDIDRIRTKVVEEIENLRDGTICEKGFLLRSAAAIVTEAFRRVLLAVDNDELWVLLSHQEELTFFDLRAANRVRCEQSFHGIDAWSPTDWACAAAGEMGEACNLVKKMRRKYTSLSFAPPAAAMAKHEPAAVAAIGEEIADAVIYLDLLAQRLGLHLADLVRDKFNKKSEEVGSPMKLNGYG